MHSIDEERLIAYLESLDVDLPDYLEDLRAAAQKDGIPIIRRSMHSLIHTLLAMKNPVKILEVGTAVGYSTLLMNHYVPEAEIVTIESYEKRIPEAKNNFAKFDTQKKITLLEGDAAKILPEIKDSFDFVFMDAAKGQYSLFLSMIMPLTTKGSIILTDNVIQDGDILESHYAIRRRDRTIHARMRDFLYEITHDDRLTTTILPIGDGAAVSVVK